MNHLIRYTLMALALGALAAGAGFALAPLQLAAEFAVLPNGTPGLGTLRANLGAGFLLLGGFTLAGLRPGQSRWLAVPIALCLALLALRLLHLGLDGASAAGLRSAAVEAALLLLLLRARRAAGLPQA